MADLEQVIKQMDNLARSAGAAVVERLPTPKDCGCSRRKKKMLKSIRGGRSAAEIVREQLADIRGKK